MTAVCGLPDVVTKCFQQAEIEERPCLVGVQDWVAAEHVIFQYTWKCPVDAAISRESPAALPEVRLNAIKLPPADCNPAAIARIHGNRRLVRSVAENVVSIRIDIDLIADEAPIRRNH